MINPVTKIIENKTPFTYFHTHVVTQKVLDMALMSGKSLEVDISADDNDELYVGHPTSFYTFKNLTMTPSVPLEEVVSAVKSSNIFLVLDCKDVRALPRIEEIVKEIGPERCLFHSWVDALLFRPFPPEMIIEPQWSSEVLPFDAVLKIKESTGVPLMLSCHGLTATRLVTEQDAILETLLPIAKGRIEAVNFNLPEAAFPHPGLVELLYENGIVPAVNVDHAPHLLPPLYLGMTDVLENATSITEEQPVLAA